MLYLLTMAPSVREMGNAHTIIKAALVQDVHKGSQRGRKEKEGLFSIQFIFVVERLVESCPSSFS